MLGMGKTILITSIIAGIAIMLLFSSQQAYAPPQSPNAAFSFFGLTNSGFDMNGGGNWVKGGPGIHAGGAFFGSGTQGSWKATGLAMCGVCTPSMSGPGVVIFFADFNGADGQTFTNKKVAVAATNTDLDGIAVNGIQNFWVEGEGFGTANARFN